jgi:protein subunit release factor A
LVASAWCVVRGVCRAVTHIDPTPPRLLSARINDAERLAVQRERSQQYQSLVGSGDRSERIRTYNFPQDRCTDHRLSGGGEGGGEGSINGVTRLLAAEAGGEDLDTLIDALDVREMTLRLEGLLETAK